LVGAGVGAVAGAAADAAWEAGVHFCRDCEVSGFLCRGRFFVEGDFRYDICFVDGVLDGVFRFFVNVVNCFVVDVDVSKYRAKWEYLVKARIKQ
jgi:hypothetical protein